MNSTVEILTIGDELLTGLIVNSNAVYLGQTLTDAGVAVGWMTVVGDSREAILAAFEQAAARARAVIITGGLGPTPDDHTKACLVEFFHDQLILREDLLAKVVQRFTSRGVEFPPESRNQAEFPQGARDIPNPHGTATGIHYLQEKTEWFALPGVPLEMRHLTESYVLPRLLDIGLGHQIAIRVYRTTGIGESFLLRQITRWVDIASLVDIAFLPNYTGVDLKLTAHGDNNTDLQRRLDQAEALLLPDLAPYYYGRDQETLAEVVGRLAREKGLKIAVAESCTGGLIAQQFTDVPGSSDYFDRGLVTYSNQAKIELLGVPADLLAQHGAVSAEVASAMATGLLQRTLADVVVAVTGIAGPTGGTADKPVGLTYIAVADRGRAVKVREFKFLGDRKANRQRAAAAALKLLYDWIRDYDA